MLNIAANVGQVPGLPDPLEIATQSRNLRALGQQNRQREMALPFEPVRLQQEQDLRGQQIQGFPVTMDAARLKNEELANDLAEMIISQEAKALRALPVEQRPEASKGLIGRLEKLREKYPDYADIYDPSHFANETWDDDSLTNWERINLSPEERAKLEAPPEAPKAGTFEDYVTKTYGPSATGQQIMQAHKDWEGAKKVPSTTVNVGGESGTDTKLREKLSEEEGKRWSELQQASVVAGSLVQDMEALDELLLMAPSGPITGRLAEAFPGFSSAGDAAEAISKRVAPSLRTPGSGATSDIEYEGFLRSLPRLRNAPGANKIISETIKAKGRLNTERGEIITRYMNDEIDSKEARKQLNALNKRSIMTPEVKAAIKKIDPGAVPKKGDEIDGYKFKGGNPADKNNWEKVK